MTIICIIDDSMCCVRSKGDSPLCHSIAETKGIIKALRIALAED